LALP
jgi:hypothetical protein